MVDDWPWRVGNINLIPILHGRVEFCVSTRDAIARCGPDAIGIELPHTLESHILRGVRRLPLISAVQFQSPAGRPAYILIEPVEPLVEAARIGLECGIEVACIDRDTNNPPSDTTMWPDSYSLRAVGLEAYVDLWLETVGEAQATLDSGAMLEEHLREVTMASRLQTLADRHERVAGIVGLAHLPALLRLLRETQVEPLGMSHRPDACLVHVHFDSTQEVLSECGYCSASYENWRRTQTNAGGSGNLQPSKRRDDEKSEFRGTARVIGFPGVILESTREHEAPAGEDRGARHGERDCRPDGDFDRWAVIRGLLSHARDRYESKDGERLSPQDMKHLFQYSRNLALVETQLVPDLYPLVLSGRGVGGDDFAYRVWEVATEYPWQDHSPRLPVARVSLEDLGRRSRRVHFERRLERQRRLRRIVRERPRERFEGEWRRSWGNNFICSHQPEDIVVEAYGRFLQQRARSLLAAEQTHVEPFTTSMLDGVDIRETMRHWYEDKIYVFERTRVKGDVGSVVVIFDRDDDPSRQPRSRYSWTMTWQGEHVQESDMALYATPPGDHPVGPGIARCEYGGFLMSYPPGRMFHVWEDPCFDLARTNAERLLLAGLDYSEERHVVYVSATPPRSWFHSYASRLGRKILYIPIGSLSPVTVKRIRVFHVLDGHHTRSFAKDYIW